VGAVTGLAHAAMDLPIFRTPSILFFSLNILFATQYRKQI